MKVSMNGNATLFTTNIEFDDNSSTHSKFT